MGLKKLFLITLFAGTMSVLGCGDDETSGTGGTGATGGDGGTGGTIDPSIECDRDLCATNDTLRDECEAFLENCLATEPEVNHDECLITALAMCSAA